MKKEFLNQGVTQVFALGRIPVTDDIEVNGLSITLTNHKTGASSVTAYINSKCSLIGFLLLWSDPVAYWERIEENEEEADYQLLFDLKEHHLELLHEGVPFSELDTDDILDCLKPFLDRFSDLSTEMLWENLRSTGLHELLPGDPHNGEVIF